MQFLQWRDNITHLIMEGLHWLIIISNSSLESSLEIEFSSLPSSVNEDTFSFGLFNNITMLRSLDFIFLESLELSQMLFIFFVDFLVFGSRSDTFRSVLNRYFVTEINFSLEVLPFSCSWLGFVDNDSVFCCDIITTDLLCDIFSIFLKRSKLELLWVRTAK